MPSPQAFCFPNSPHGSSHLAEQHRHQKHRSHCQQHGLLSPARLCEKGNEPLPRNLPEECSYSASNTLPCFRADEEQSVAVAELFWRSWSALTGWSWRENPSPRQKWNPGCTRAWRLGSCCKGQAESCSEPGSPEPEASTKPCQAMIYQSPPVLGLFQKKDHRRL